MNEQCGHEIALEKRLNEIRRLEGINDDLLTALKKALTEHRQQELGYNSACWCIDAEAAIKKAKLPA